MYITAEDNKPLENNILGERVVHGKILRIGFWFSIKFGKFCGELNRLNF